MPEAALGRDFIARVRDVLHRYTSMDIDLWLHSVQVLNRSQLRALIPGVTLIHVIGLAPLSEKILFEVDLRFVYRVVDRLLGGNGLAIDIHRPLTEIEQGVFSYLALKVLALFYEQGVASPEQVAIRLEDMRSDLKSVADIVRHEDTWLCASWKMNFDLDVAYLRALVPASLARRALGQPPPADAAVVGRIHQRIRSRMQRLAGIRVDCIIQAGQIELTRADFRALDPGDIVLLDQAMIALQNGEPAGQCAMRIGLGRRGLVHGLLRSVGRPGARREEKQLVFEVAMIETTVTPPDHDPVMHHGEMGNPEDVIAAYEDGQDGEEADDGPALPGELFDEDFGIDDENEGDDEQYEEGEQYEGEQYEEGAYDEQGYGEEQAYQDGGHGGQEAPADDNLAEAEPLLGDVPIAVVVEIGRVQLTADEVIRLRAGQIIELGRSPADPVDLVVAGKLLAKGELVEIDGALGIKILSLVKE